MTPSPFQDPQTRASRRPMAPEPAQYVIFLVFFPALLALGTARVGQSLGAPAGAAVALAGVALVVGLFVSLRRSHRRVLATP